jgi:hypothetical protein
VTSIRLPVGGPINEPRLVVGFSEGIYHIMERAAPVFAILAETAKNEPELANLQNRIRTDRLENMRRVARAIGSLVARNSDQAAVPG